MNILIVGVGGHHVKILATGQSDRREFESGPELTAQAMVDGVKKLADGWEFEAVSLGYPGPTLRGRTLAEPKNLGKGWVGFDHEEAFGCPVKLINDAAMQAAGSYQGGRMLFLGLGTGLGSAMIVEGIVEPMELAHGRGDEAVRLRSAMAAIVNDGGMIPEQPRIGRMERHTRRMPDGVKERKALVPPFPRGLMGRSRKPVLARFGVVGRSWSDRIGAGQIGSIKPGRKDRGRGGHCIDLAGLSEAARSRLAISVVADGRRRRLHASSVWPREAMKPSHRCGRTVIVTCRIGGTTTYDRYDSQALRTAIIRRPSRRPATPCESDGDDVSGCRT